MSSKRNRIRPPRIVGAPKSSVDVKAIATLARDVVRDELDRREELANSRRVAFRVLDDERPETPAAAVAERQAVERLHARANGASVAAETPKLEQSLQGLEALCKRLDQAHGDVLVFCDSKLGPEPQDAAPSGSSPPRSGQAGQVLDLIESAHRITSRIEAELRRLRAL